MRPEPFAGVDVLTMLMPSQVKGFEYGGLDPLQFLAAIRTIFDIKYDSLATISVGGIPRLFVRFDSPQMASRAQMLWERMNTPRRDIQLCFQLLQALAERRMPSERWKTAADRPPGGKLLGQLEALFRFDDYRVLSTSTVVTQAGRPVAMMLEGLPAKDKGGNSVNEVFTVSVMPLSIPEEDGAIRLESLEIKRGAPYYDLNSFLNTTLNLKDGQTVVVGGSAIDGVTYVVAVTANLMP